jgi:hypothetical protein
MSVVGPTRTIFTARIAAAVKGKADFRPNDPLLKLPRGVDKNPPNTGKRPAANPQTSCHEPALISQQPRTEPAATFYPILRETASSQRDNRAVLAAKRRLRWFRGALD